ncbi:MAG: hypothetical protein HOV80_05015 [Polyangiaceae bacterium]|nr:hypothetical protein [Polyangiaceae bacterium]
MQPTSPSQEPNLAELSAKFDDLEPWGYGEGLQAPVNVYVINVGFPLLVIALLFVGWWWRKRRADHAARAEERANDPAEGEGEVVVRGKVCDVEGNGPAVEVTVEQLGLERKEKGDWKTTWTEISRRTEARPFTIELSNGSRLRVEPGEEPRLVDDLGLWKRTDSSTKVPATRTASATLDLDEEVYVAGELDTRVDPAVGYRGGEARVLRPPKGGAMHLSTHGLAAPFREQSRRFASWITGLVVLTALVQLAAIQFHVALWAGERKTATIEKRWEVPVAEQKTPEYFVTYRPSGSSDVIKEQIEIVDWDRLEPGTVVPIHVSPLETTLGPHPNITGIIPMLSTLVLVVVGTIALTTCYRRRAWYERRMVETQSGRLDE